ncbi:hypothetical protein RND71_011852 [Anisodus tanguticus]|uniref:Uncharacterized protein n=1 Tax=Anisodus tanguticus TaxID=243964 RepID=A0AAE1SE30_9SOLA|nr:hypothetical protein RND71_011852 [Anisodus tanguticus]
MYDWDPLRCRRLNDQVKRVFGPLEAVTTNNSKKKEPLSEQEDGAWHLMSGVRRRGRCSARYNGAFGRTAREWCSACVVRLDPCSSSDLLPHVPFQSWGERRLGSLKVNFMCCIPNAWALSRTNGCLSTLAFRARAEPEATLASHIFLASPCHGMVYV